MFSLILAPYSRTTRSVWNETVTVTFKALEECSHPYLVNSDMFLVLHQTSANLLIYFNVLRSRKKEERRKWMQLQSKSWPNIITFPSADLKSRLCKFSNIKVLFALDKHVKSAVPSCFHDLGNVSRMSPFLYHFHSWHLIRFTVLVSDHVFRFKAFRLFFFSCLSLCFKKVFCFYCEAVCTALFKSPYRFRCFLPWIWLVCF